MSLMLSVLSSQVIVYQTKPRTAREGVAGKLRPFPATYLAGRGKPGCPWSARWPTSRRRPKLDKSLEEQGGCPQLWRVAIPRSPPPHPPKTLIGCCELDQYCPAEDPMARPPPPQTEQLPNRRPTSSWVRRSQAPTTPGIVASSC